MSPTKTLQVKLARDTYADSAPADATALCVFEDEPRLPVAAESLDDSTRRAIEDLLRAGEFNAETGDALIVHVANAARADENAARQEGAHRVLLVGLGRHADFDSSELRRAAGLSVRRAREAHVRHLRFVPPEVSRIDALELARVVAEGAHLGFYENDFYQEREAEDEPALEQFSIVATDAPGDALRDALEHARIVAGAANWARSLADEPGASLPPREFARRAAEMAAEFGLAVETLQADEIRARGMGGLWGVGQGSDEPPALIVLRYEPEGASVEDELWAFVGKGITFDTGGISIKPAAGMEEMKSDMAGGAAALGAVRAIAELKLKRRVVAVVPTAENMPSGRALKPGDIVRTLAGYTIEVVDTDAEGRLVLVDGIAYARALGATRIVDLATLTGSIIVALGDHRTGLFANDDDWAKRVQAAATRAGEPAWRMPVSDDYKKKIESPIADFKNYGGRPDATAAALLLSKVAAETPWVHLDIAATSWHEDPKPHAPAGATGTGVRTLVELAEKNDEVKTGKW
ncbi:MAG TPA: leucyl aminopeptidase [Pyrinomonadaceae bacterium]|nr:leucyl aminopeptidase [Pyrinomonadaceae bacterium]